VTFAISAIALARHRTGTPNGNTKVTDISASFMAHSFGRRVAVNSWGVFVVVIVGIGFAAYGVFCLVTFTRRRLQAP
jgi:hypothetical protein